jgi:hypothetical protein
MTKFFAPVPLRRPEDARPFLRDSERHWRDGYSAAGLAKSWIVANDIPAPVRAVLDTCEGYRGTSLVAAIFEKQVDLGTPGGEPADIMAIVAGGAGLAMLAVEGEVEESFDRVVSDWLKQSRRDDGRNGGHASAGFVNCLASPSIAPCRSATSCCTRPRPRSSRRVGTARRAQFCIVAGDITRERAFGRRSVFAEFERAMIRERVNAGLAQARGQGKRLGRPLVDAAAEARVR